MLDSKAVGNRINVLRSSNGLSQDQLAEKLFVTRQAVSRWELGQSLPSIDSLLEMSKLFSVSFEDILCLNQKTSIIDPNNLFNGHSRDYVVKSIIEGKTQVNLSNVIHLFSPLERMMLLQAIKENKLKTNTESLFPKLNEAEKTYLKDGLGKHVRQLENGKIYDK